MKKKVFALVLACAACLSLLAACGSKKNETVTLKVGATPAPHADILEQVKPILAEQNINLEIVEFTDYVQPNNVVESGEIDANYFQHIPYLDDFNAQNGTHLVTVCTVHVEPMAVFGGKQASLDAVK